MALKPEQVEDLKNTPPRLCNECAQEIRKNYCIDHEEFFWEAYRGGCSLHDSTQHASCRTYDGEVWYVAKPIPDCGEIELTHEVIRQCLRSKDPLVAALAAKVMQLKTEIVAQELEVHHSMFW